MADNVVPFSPPKAANEDDEGSGLHLATSCLCLACRHKWVGVAPIGTTSFECPACGTERGVSTTHIGPDDGTMWTCGCGGWAFAYSKKYGMMCLSCGTPQKFD